MIKINLKNITFTGWVRNDRVKIVMLDMIGLDMIG